MGSEFRYNCVVCGRVNSLFLLRKEDAVYEICGCGLVYNRRIPDEVTLKETAEEWSRIHHASPQRLKWENDTNLQEVIYGFRMREIAKRRFKGKLLDVGCSTGFFLDYASRKGWEVFGCELSENSANIARSRGNSEIAIGSFPDIGYPSRYFDVVTMWDVVEHVREPALFVSEAFRVLRPGGLLALSTPNYDSLTRMMIGARWEAIIPSRHLQLFTPKTLKMLVCLQGGWVRACKTVDVNPWDILMALAKGKKYDISVRNEAISRAKALFAKYPFLAVLREMVNAFLSVVKVGDTIELYAEKWR